jgi:hypothetical protein
VRLGILVVLLGRLPSLFCVSRGFTGHTVILPIESCVGEKRASLWRPFDPSMVSGVLLIIIHMFK